MSTAGGSGKVPLYRKIYEEIRRDIASGIYQPGEVLPSIRDKAGMEGVARRGIYPEPAGRRVYRAGPEPAVPERAGER